MKYSRGQFTNEYYQLWDMGLLISTPMNASVYSVKYRKNQFDEYSRVTLKAVGVHDALERACYAITYASSWRPEDVDLHAVYDEDENLLWIDEPFYDLVQKKNEFRGMERREFLAKFGITSAAILFGLRPLSATAGTAAVTFGGTATGFTAPPGEQLYVTAGSYIWTVPALVTSVCVVCVGGGGCGGLYGGGGGALRYVNTISVSPAGTISIVTGAGGAANSGNAGGSSSFAATVIASGGGGGNSSAGLGGTSGTGSGGNGGSGGATSATWGTGGGGAGGYAGNGGNGGDVNSSWSGLAGAGGGAGGGGSGTNTDSNDTMRKSGGGGGVGLNGQGANGNGGVARRGGLAGSGGVDGSPPDATFGGAGGAYGGGSGGCNSAGFNSNAGTGAVRIIWGAGRSFPSNAV